MNKILIFCIMVTLVSIGCKKENLSDADLLENKWILSYIQATQTNVITNYPSDAAKKISIVFRDSLNVLGFSGVCNGGAGTYSFTTVSGGIKISDLYTTLIACKYVEWETYTVQSLYYAFSYEINGNNLVIYSNSAYNLYFTKN